MKVFSVLVIFTAQFLISKARPTLRSEIRQVLELINLNKINEIFREYSENDPSIQEVANYLNSDEVGVAWIKFVDSSEVEDIIQWMRSHGVNVENEIQNFSTIPDSVTITPSRLRTNRSPPNYSVQALEDEVKEQILIEELNDLIDELIGDGNDFAHLYLILQLSRPALNKLFNEPEILLATESLRNLGVNVGYLKFLIYKILRWN